MVSSLINSEINNLQRKIKDYLTIYKKVVGSLPIMKSTVGLKLSKFHSLRHIDLFIRDYGAPLNFFEGYLEEFLKIVVNKIYPRTTHQYYRYLYDLTVCLQENQCLES